jgi:hypothetical protein
VSEENLNDIALGKIQGLDFASLLGVLLQLVEGLKRSDSRVNATRIHQVDDVDVGLLQDLPM